MHQYKTEYRLSLLLLKPVIGAMMMWEEIENIGLQAKILYINLRHIGHS